MKTEELFRSDPAFYADMEAYRRSGEWEIAHESPTALWLRWRRDRLHAIAAFDPAEARELLRKIPPKDAVVLRGCKGLDRIATEAGFNGCSPCRQALYESSNPIPVRTALTIRHPDESDYPKVAESYHMIDADELRADFNRPDFLGAYLDRTFVGYIGVHNDGAMGMLYVFPPYRRHGYAEALCGALINRQLEKGRLPFAQILADNEESLRLQRKIGLSISAGPIYWMWRDGDA